MRPIGFMSKSGIWAIILKKKLRRLDKKELYWVQQLRNWQKEFTNPDEFIESLKIDFFKDRIFAITPKGEVIDLPSGVTPVDFAYHIHTAVGNSCVGARVNDKIVPLDYALKSGDIVEIMTQKNKKPSESWLTFVKTNHARNHIRAALKTKPEGLSAKEPEGSELRITVEDKPDLISQITAVISRSHANILAVNTITNSRFPSFRIKCDAANKRENRKTSCKIEEDKRDKRNQLRFLH